jgi:hypothetical protein
MVTCILCSIVSHPQSILTGREVPEPNEEFIIEGLDAILPQQSAQVEEKKEMKSSLPPVVMSRRTSQVPLARLSADYLEAMDEILPEIDGCARILSLDRSIIESKKKPSRRPSSAALSTDWKP